MNPSTKFAHINRPISRSRRLLVLTVSLVFLLVGSFTYYVLTEKQIDAANNHRYLCEQLADELRQTSDDLTRMARSYVITGNPIYEQHFYEILDLRNGKRPRPERYNDIYWDLVGLDDSRPRPTTNQVIPLLSMMKQAGFTDAEFAKLAEAKMNSEDLTKTEFMAMALMKSAGPNAVKNREKARAMLFDQNYLAAKTAIMKPIDEFYVMMDKRTTNAVNSAIRQALVVRGWVIVIAALLLCMLWLNYRQLEKILGGSIFDVYRHLERLGKGDFSVPVSVYPDRKYSVLGYISDTQANLANLESLNQALLERTQKQANYDTLTSLPNRLLFFDRLSKSLSQARRNENHAALLFIDLDGFKPVNDIHGHDAGDYVLKVVSQRWTECMRAVDTIARLGGDEFAVILNELENPREAATVAEKLIQTIAIRIDLPNGKSCQVGASIGISIYPDNATEMDELLAAADDAMYQSKNKGKNTYTYSEVVPKDHSENKNWVVFDNSHLVGIFEIDGQHRELVQRLNQLDRMLTRPDTETYTKPLFDELLNFLRHHFETEYRYMLDSNFPQVTSHHAEHHRLLTEITFLASNINQGNELLVLQTIKDWLLNHIDHWDKPLGAFLTQHGIN